MLNMTGVQHEPPGHIGEDQEKQAILRFLYKDARANHQIIADQFNLDKPLVSEKIAQMEQDDVILDYSAIVDPRTLGYWSPAYMFIDSGEFLFEAFDSNSDQFGEFGEPLLLGIVLGDVDVIHRRVDRGIIEQAQFVKESLNSPEKMHFSKNQETSPINEIIRWHGGRVPSDNRLLDIEPSRFLDPDNDPTGRDVLLELIENGRKTRSQIAKDLDLTSSKVKSAKNDLEGDVILGYSIDFDIGKTPWMHALMGISMAPGANAHSDVVQSLLEAAPDYMDEFHMPYVSSGVGQNWGDIVVELTVDSVTRLNNIATWVRNITVERNGEEIHPVDSTRTYLMTTTVFDNLFVPSNWPFTDDEADRR